ncbi:helix-turn-helix transcriptional regulator [Bacillus sp. N9]
MANHVYLNPDYVTRIFKRETGLSISEYLQQERIDTAKKLLIHTNKPISDIAIESGYSSFSYFSTIFKKVTQCSPVEFRKLNVK